MACLGCPWYEKTFKKIFSIILVCIAHAIALGAVGGGSFYECFCKDVALAVECVRSIRNKKNQKPKEMVLFGCACGSALEASEKMQKN